MTTATTTPKYNLGLALSQLFLDYCLVHFVHIGELSCNWMVTNGFKVKIENRGVVRIFQGGGGVTFSHTHGTYWSSTVFLVKVTIFWISSKCVGGEQAYKIAAYTIDLRCPWTRAFFQSALWNVDFSLRLKKI